MLYFLPIPDFHRLTRSLPLPVLTRSKLPLANQRTSPMRILNTILVCLLLSCVTTVAQNRDEKSSDGPIKVHLGDVYKKGNIKIEDVDVSSLPPLPRGYSAMPRMAYRITTDAEAVGPYTVVFGVNSISDEQIFNSLRIFHAEPDAFDPDSPVWVDRTGSGKDTPASDYSHK